MIVTVGSTLTFDRTEADTDFFHALRSALTWDNPAWKKANDAGRKVRGIPSRLCYLRCTPGRAHVPRGAVRLFSRLASRHDIPIEWEPEVVTTPGNRCELDDLDITQPWRRCTSRSRDLWCCRAAGVRQRWALPP